MPMRPSTKELSSSFSARCSQLAFPSLSNEQRNPWTDRASRTSGKLRACTPFGWQRPWQFFRTFQPPTNRFVLAGPDGSLVCYDKQHLFSLGGETRRFAPGLVDGHCGWRPSHPSYLLRLAVRVLLLERGTGDRLVCNRRKLASGATRPLVGLATRTRH